MEKKFFGGIFLRDETKTKLAALKFENFPSELENFVVEKIFEAQDDKFIFFRCVDAENHCTLTIYFHEETNEFKIAEKIGLTEFCLTKFFTEDFERFKNHIDAEIRSVLKDLGEIRRKEPHIFLLEKEIDAWSYGKSLPATIEGFELFIKPSAPVEVTNGSFIVINYVDFAANSDFIVYYNVFGDEFSGERRINGAPEVTYAFDSKTLPELEEKLKNHLIDELKAIRR